MVSERLADVFGKGHNVVILVHVSSCVLMSGGLCEEKSRARTRDAS